MDLKKIERFIDKQKVSIICSIDDQEYPNVKAMLKPRKRVGLKEFYFSTNTSSMRVSQYKKNPKASIYFYHKVLIKYVGVMLKGKMEVLTDQKTKDMIWKRGDTMFYKKRRNGSGLLCAKNHRNKRSVLLRPKNREF